MSSKSHILAETEIMDFYMGITDEGLYHAHAEVRLHAHCSPFWL